MTLILHEVLTLEEVADYLRLPAETVEREAARGRIPGRQVENTWRFLKSAIDEWLHSQDSWFDELYARRRKEGREVLLEQAGALAEDETLSDLLGSIYAKRKRPETEKGS